MVTSRRPAGTPAATSRSCVKSRSYAGVRVDRPSPRSVRAVSALVALSEKSPCTVSAWELRRKCSTAPRCRARIPSGRSRSKRLSYPSSPGFCTRGVATITRAPAARARSTAIPSPTSSMKSSWTSSKPSRSATSTCSSVPSKGLSRGVPVARLRHQRRPDRAAHMKAHAHLPLLCGDALHLAGDVRVLRLPDHVAGFHQPQIERRLARSAEDQLQEPRCDHVAGVKSAPRLLVLGLALIEQHPIARLQLRRIRLGSHQHVPCARVYFLDAPDQDAAMSRIEPMHQFLMIGPAQESVRKTAREAVAQ